MTERTHLPCPDKDGCGSSDAYAWNESKGVGHCHSCRLDTWVFQDKLYGKRGKQKVLVEQDTEVIEATSDPFLVVKDNKSGDGFTTEYRGIKAHVRETYGVLQYTNPNRVEYIYPSGGKKVRYMDEKSFSTKGFQSDELFGMQLFPSGCSKIVTITEGEEDAMAAYQMLSSGGYTNPVVSLPTATPKKGLWEKAFKWLDSFEKIVLSFDNDGKSDHLQETLFDLFPNKVYVMNHGDVKDANDFLLQGKQKDYKSSWWAAKPYSPAGFVASVEDWFEALDNETPYEYTPTPIKGFNEINRGLVKGGITVVKAPPGTGKCLGVDTPVMMWDGSVKAVQDIVKGDLLMGDDSTPRKVMATTSGEDFLYRITPVKGDVWVCNSQHVLSLYHNTHKKVYDIGIQDYLNESADFLHHAKQYRAPVDEFGAEPDLPVHPYLFGVFLGDGSKTRQEVFLGQKKEAVRVRVKQLVEDMGFGWSETYYEDKNCWGIRIRSHYKRNPFCNVNVNLVEDYKVSSVEERKQFLAGLLDTDGYLTNGCYDIIQKDKRIADAVVFTARSLGLAAYIKPVEKGIKSRGFVGNYFRVSISGDVDKLPTLRHDPPVRKQIKNVLNTGIRVEPIGVGKFYGFELDGNHRFLLGDFTVTHNSSMLRMLQHDLVVTHNKPIAVLMMEEMKSTTGRAMATYQIGKNVMTKEDAQNNGVSEEAVKEALREVVGDHKFVSFDINPQNAIEDCLRQCKYAVSVYGAEYLFIDHLQRLAYLGGTDTATAALTELGVKLTEFAKRKNVGIICISHVNQDGKTKYASSIEEEAIMIIEMERDKQSDDPREQNTTYLSTSKNRPFALTGPCGMLMYDRETTMVSERFGTHEGDSSVFDEPSRAENTTANLRKYTNDDIPF